MFVWSCSLCQRAPDYNDGDTWAPFTGIQKGLSIYFSLMEVKGEKSDRRGWGGTGDKTLRIHCVVSVSGSSSSLLSSTVNLLFQFEWFILWKLRPQISSPQASSLMSVFRPTIGCDNFSFKWSCLFFSFNCLLWCHLMSTGACQSSLTFVQACKCQILPFYFPSLIKKPHKLLTDVKIRKTSVAIVQYNSNSPLVH